MWFIIPFMADIFDVVNDLILLQFIRDYNVTCQPLFTIMANIKNSPKVILFDNFH